MAATIDHLRVDHHVIVCADFTDARGIAHHREDRGVLRGMGLDTATMELWLEWEVGATTERLHFALHARTGPRSGHMRDYFTLGAEVTSPASVAPTVTAPPAHDEIPEAAVPPVLGQCPAGTDLGERTVACGCPVALHRPVLALGTGVHACMRCGVVTCAHAIGDDGRHTGDAWTRYIVDDVPVAMLRWLALWPRVTVHQSLHEPWDCPPGLRRDETIYLSPLARCETAEDLRVLEQQSRGPVDRALFPSQPSPGPLPPPRHVFAQFADVVRLSPDGDLAALVSAADPHHAASALAVSMLLARDGAIDFMLDALQRDVRTWQWAGAAMAFTAAPVDARLPEVIARLLAPPAHGTPRTEQGGVAGAARYKALLTVIGRHRIATPAVLEALVTLRRAVARPDPELAGQLGSVLRELRQVTTTHGETP